MGGTLLKSLGLLFLLMAIISPATSQTPQSINYQAVARDLSTGQELPETSILVVFKLRSGGPNGDILYQETHDTETDGFGLFNLRIGEGEPIDDTFDEIDWGGEQIWLSVSVDAGDGLEELSTTQLVSVPYALHAETASNVDDADSDPNNEIIQSFSLADSILTLEESTGAGDQSFQVDMADVLADPDTDPDNERVVDFSMSDSTLFLVEGEGVDQQEFQVQLNELLQDGDVEIGNEWITSMALQNDTLRIIEGTPPDAELVVLDLSPLVEDDDADPENELIDANSFSLNGTTLSISEAGTTYQVDLASLEDDDDWEVTDDEVYVTGKNVGVNTSSPGSPLEVKGDAANTGNSVIQARNDEDELLLDVKSDKRTGVGAPASSSTMHVGGSFSAAVLNVEATSTPVLNLDETHHIVLCNVSSAPMEVILPDASSCEGRQYFIKRIGTLASVTIDTTGGDTIDGQSSIVLSSLTTQQVGAVSDGQNWWLFSR